MSKIKEDFKNIWEKPGILDPKDKNYKKKKKEADKLKEIEDRKDSVIVNFIVGFIATVTKELKDTDLPIFLKTILDAVEKVISAVFKTILAVLSLPAKLVKSALPSPKPSPRIESGKQKGGRVEVDPGNPATLGDSLETQPNLETDSFSKIPENAAKPIGAVESVDSIIEVGNSSTKKPVVGKHTSKKLGEEKTRDSSRSVTF